MKIRTLFLASTLIVTAAGVALAQSPNSTPDKTGSKTPDASTSSGATSNDTMAKDSMANDKMKKSHTTTGAGTNPTKDTSEKDVSPGSQDAGVKQVK